MSNILVHSRKRADVQNLVGFDLVITNLRMREKYILCGFFKLTYLSIFPLLRRGYRSQFWADFKADFNDFNGSNDVISQPLVPFGGHINIAPC